LGQHGNSTTNEEEVRVEKVTIGKQIQVTIG